MNENKKIGEPSLEAIDFAKRMIALKWTRETNVDIIAGNWMAGYVYGKIDSNKESASDKDKEIIERLIEDTLKQNKEIERLKGLIEKAFKECYTLGRVHPGNNKNKDYQQFKTENNL